MTSRNEQLAIWDDTEVPFAPDPEVIHVSQLIRPGDRVCFYCEGPLRQTGSCMTCIQCGNTASRLATDAGEITPCVEPATG